MPRITIKDIAKITNVSIATVSRVLNNKGSYSKATEKLVLQTAKELGYHRNTSAVELVTQKSNSLAVITTASDTNFKDQILAGIQEEALKLDINVIIVSAGRDNAYLQKRALETVLQRPVMGIIIVSVEFTKNNLCHLQQSKIPYIFLSLSFNNRSIPFISSDDYAIGYQATRFLYEHGYRRIGLTGIRLDSFIARQRIDGYLTALKDCQLDFRSDWLQENDFTYEAGQSALNKYHELNNVDAIIAASDVTAIGILNKAEDLKIKVPQQIALLSIDGTDLCKIVRPKLSSVTQAFFKMGVDGVRFINSTILTNLQNVQNNFVPFKIMERQST
ncbi:LacI family DNA-binding transcriptional regulator [Bombilactobacillus bombi]|uniref:LacI family DNA-binding transcriptional regulator n=1 Tax=Bombilactobacillus bombi TaxID=1303590 RepID=UPI0015E5CB70|nr:LacI family DNA-binding transcriptional regulator [Bombilactobacillus bombi]MBA1433680.1 LacI family transcriptional regulator [Bombilactobacillus bombi]